MMNHSNDDSSTDSTDTNIDFGSLLAEGRKAKNFTVEDVSEHLKIPVRTITALEANDREALPAPTFAQGYIRTYAKFLEISEDEVLGIYNRAVPHDDVSDLKPRSNLPGEASSQTPLIKTITVSLIIAGIAAVGFGSFQYYQEKAGVMESELDARQQSFTGNSLDSPGANRLNIKQNARLTDEGELIVAQSDPNERTPEGAREEGARAEADGLEEIASETIEPEEIDPGQNEPEEISETANTDEIRVLETSKTEAANLAAGRFADAVTASAGSRDISPEDGRNRVASASGGDIIEIYAENGSWVEVRDANKSRLLYTTLPVGGRKVLEGQAPFSITMGNARTTRVVINDLEIDVSGYIRPNNTASFKVSTQGQEIIFH